ncbi:protein required for maturation of hydrogenases [Desulfosarcina cetonica]|uniref:hydrogenase formation protein HypD n=1 Tax=Desulfosarcina cetonica TaxID=90730 RepID=UPI0006CF4071|nr:hydrogenase formation protein HypD [Desulfosarcina cetonica]VTR69479.1 protein required for maturation of hydrogenases [Desulfosarcina cetonica]
MTLSFSQSFHDPRIARHLAERIAGASHRPIRLMEVCGTHTVAIFRSGIRSLLPPTITLLSGPGCPVCVTAQKEIDAFIALARQPDTILATFGDLMRVPGTGGTSLQREKAEGADVRMVYASFDALTLARQNPDKRVVFLGVGFETTAPTVAAAILAAEESGLTNFSVMSAHKLVPPALETLASGAINIDGFLLPGHVSVIIGRDAYGPFFDAHRIPCVVAGFEPTDLLQAIAMLVEQIDAGRPALTNAYVRAVTDRGNPKAVAVMERVFAVADADWRGIGTLPASGLVIRETYAAFDALRVFGIRPVPAAPPKGCACGEILTGVKIPPQCPLYKRVCNPMAPVGPCMVSSEGTCAAYYRYHADD